MYIVCVFDVISGIYYYKLYYHGYVIQLEGEEVECFPMRRAKVILDMDRKG